MWKIPYKFNSISRSDLEWFSRTCSVKQMRFWFGFVFNNPTEIKISKFKSISSCLFKEKRSEKTTM